MTWTIPAVGRHTSGYGPRNTGIPGASTYHRGHDIAPPVKGQRGVPVWAVGPGRVAGREYNSARGRFVRIRHDDGSMTLCQHLDRFDVAYGQRVATGQQIGLMGDSGVGAGVHLHFECYEAGRNAYVLANAVDPVAFMRHRGVDLATGARLVDLDRPIPTVPDLPVFPDLPELRRLTMRETFIGVGPDKREYLINLTTGLFEHITDEDERDALGMRYGSDRVRLSAEGLAALARFAARVRRTLGESAADAVWTRPVTVHGQTVTVGAAIQGLANA